MTNPIAFHRMLVCLAFVVISCALPAEASRRNKSVSLNGGEMHLRTPSGALRNRLKTPGEPERIRFFGQIRLIFGCIAGGSVPKNSRNMPGKDAAFGPAGVFRRFLIPIGVRQYFLPAVERCPVARYPADRPVNGLDPVHFVLDSSLISDNNATLILTGSVADTVISPGDEIGVFTKEGALCGAAIYEGANLAVTVWGDDPATNAIVEGMQTDSAYYFKVWDASEQKECIAYVTFLSGSNAYEPDAIEIIQNLALCKNSDTLITAVACNSYTLNNQTYGSSGFYTQVLANIAGCDSIITLDLTINPLPAVTVNGDTICSGQTAILIASGAANYLWSTGATTNTITVSPDTTTTYTVTGISAGCLSDPAAAQVLVNPAPIVSLGPDTIVINTGEVATLIANSSPGGLNYHWSTGADTDAISVELPGTYSVTVSTNSTPPCTATDSVFVRVLVSTNDGEIKYKIFVSPNPASGIIYIVCEGNSTALVQVIDNTGRVVLQDNAIVSSGTQRSLNLNSLPQGLYYLRIVSDRFTRTISVVKRI